MCTQTFVFGSFLAAVPATTGIKNAFSGLTTGGKKSPKISNNAIDTQPYWRLKQKEKSVILIFCFYIKKQNFKLTVIVFIP